MHPDLRKAIAGAIMSAGSGMIGAAVLLYVQSRGGRAALLGAGAAALVGGLWLNSMFADEDAPDAPEALSGCSGCNGPVTIDAQPQRVHWQ